jgi:hypothetical protein
MPKQTALPYVYAEDELSLYVVDAQLDDTDHEGRIALDKRRVALEDLEDWDTATFLVEVEAPDDIAERLLPQDERSDPPWEIALVVFCSEAKWRKQFPLERKNGSGWRGQIEVSRNNIRGALDLQAFLVRTDDREEPVGKYAHRSNVRLASSQEWKIYFDESQSPPGGYLPTVWKDFSEDEELQPKSEQIYHLDFSRNPPVLYLNNSITGLERILENQGTTGLSPAVRDTLYDSIAQSVWMSLGMNAFLSAYNDEGEEEALSDWEQSVFDRFRKRLMDDFDDPGRSARRPEDIDGLMQAMCDAVQNEVNLHESTEKILKRV